MKNENLPAMRGQEIDAMITMSAQDYATYLGALTSEEIVQMKTEIMNILEEKFTHYYGGASDKGDLADAYAGYTPDELKQLFAEHKTFRKVMMAIGTPASYKVLSCLINELADNRSNRHNMLFEMLNQHNDIKRRDPAFIKSIWISMLEYSLGSTEASKEMESIKVWQQALINAKSQIGVARSL